MVKEYIQLLMVKILKDNGEKEYKDMIDLLS